MATRQIRFRGIDGAECDDFIYDIQTLELPPDIVHKGQMYKDSWRAEAALARMTGAALEWSESLDYQTCHDWMKLRRQMMNKWRSPTEQRQQHGAFNIPAAPAAAASVVTPPARASSVMFGPSPRVYPYIDQEFPVFNIKVVAPKVSHTSYVSTVYNDSEFGGRCCILTAEKAQALKCMDVRFVGHKTSQLFQVTLEEKRLLL